MNFYSQSKWLWLAHHCIVNTYNYIYITITARRKQCPTERTNKIIIVTIWIDFFFACKFVILQILPLPLYLYVGWKWNGRQNVNCIIETYVYINLLDFLSLFSNPLSSGIIWLSYNITYMKWKYSLIAKNIHLDFGQTFFACEFVICLYIHM